MAVGRSKESACKITKEKTWGIEEDEHLGVEEDETLLSNAAKISIFKGDPSEYPMFKETFQIVFPEGCASDRMLITHWSIWLRTYDNEWRSVLKDISPLRLCGSEWMTNLVTP